jgi:pre-mRNA cleavage complex 2 protein Pcf11
MTEGSIQEFESKINSPSLSEEDIPHLTDIANDLRIIKSDDITKLIMDKLTAFKADNLIITLFKLIDSILCNVTTPYNEKFSEPLSVLFKKKYLVLNNAHRQILITIFESWVEKSNQSLTQNDDDMFDDVGVNKNFLSKSTLKRIETFLIKASLLHERRFLEGKEKEGMVSQKLSITKSKSPSDLSVPTVKDLLVIISKILEQMKESLNKQYNEEVQQRLFYLNKVQDLLSTKKIENGNEIIEIFNKLKSLPEYAKVMDSTKETNDRVNKFIEKSKIAKVNEMKALLEDFKSLDHKETTNDSFLAQTWTKEKYQTALEKFNKKDKENIISEEQSFKSNTKALPELNVLTNISKDLQSSKLKMSDFIKLDIKSENLANWSKYIQLMYRSMPEKCSICGKRFLLTKKDSMNTALNANKRTFMLLNASNNDSDSSIVQNDESKKFIEQHMDWHYETISKSQIMTKTGIRKMMVNRTWYGTNSHLAVLKQDTSNLMDEERDTKRRKYEEDTPRSDEVKYVVVPKELMGELNEIECAICRDNIKVSYVENIGEWCMINCKETNQGYVHITCLQ